MQALMYGRTAEVSDLCRAHFFFFGCVDVSEESDSEETQ